MTRMFLRVMLALSQAAVAPGLTCKDETRRDVPCEELRVLSAGWFDKSGFVYHVLWQALNFTISIVNAEQKLLPGHWIVMDAFNTGGDPTTGLTRYLEHVAPDVHKYLVFIGGDDKCVIEIGTIAPSYKMPYVGWNFVSGVADRPPMNSYFSAKAVPGRLYMPFIFEIILAAGWKRIGFIHSEHVLSEAQVNGIRQEMQRLNVSIAVERIMTKDRDTLIMATMASFVRALKDARVNIVLVASYDMDKLFCTLVLEKVAGLTILSAGDRKTLWFYPPPSGYENECSAEKIIDISTNVVFFDRGDIARNLELTCLPGMQIADVEAWWATRKAELIRNPALLGEWQDTMTGDFYDSILPLGYDAACLAVMGLREMLFNKRLTALDLYQRNDSMYADMLHAYQNVQFNSSNGHFEFVDGGLPGYKAILCQFKSRGVEHVAQEECYPSRLLTSSRAGKATNEGLLELIDWPHGQVPKDTWDLCLDGEERMWGKCVKCEPGYVQQRAIHKGVCSRCAVGSYRNASMPSITCAICPGGTFNSEVGSTSCDTCRLGEMASQAGSSSCDKCGQGHYSNTLGADTCTQCPIGKYNGARGQTACNQCGASTIPQASNVTLKQESLHGTRSFTTQFRGERSLSACKCSERFRPVVLHGSPTYCARCTEGISCRKFGAEPLVSPGYFMWKFAARTSQTIDIWRCMSRQACPGQTESTDPICAPKFTGLNCGRCEDGYYRMGTHSCHKCGSSAGIIYAVFPVSFVVCGILHKSWNTRTERSLLSATSSIAVSFVQTLAILETFRISWPEKFRSIQNTAGLSLIDLDFLRFGCSVPQELSIHYSIRLLLPHILCAMFGFWYPVSKGIHSVTCARFPSFNLNEICNSVGMVTQTFFISHVAGVLSYLECYESPNGKRSIRSYPDSECYNEEYWALFPLVVCGFLVNVVMVFAVYAWLAIVAPARYPVSVGFRIRVRFMTFKWRSAMWWYTLPALIRSASMGTLNVITTDNGFLQCALLDLILIIALIYHIKWKPYIERWANRLEAYEFSLLLLMVKLGMWSTAQQIGNEGNYESNRVVLDWALVGVFALGILGILLVLCMAAMIYLYPHKPESRHRRDVNLLLERLQASAMIVNNIEEDDLRNFLDTCNYLDRRGLVTMTDIIALELCGLVPTSFFNQRLALHATEITPWLSEENFAEVAASRVSNVQSLTPTAEANSKSGPGFFKTWKSRSTDLQRQTSQLDHVARLLQVQRSTSRALSLYSAGTDVTEGHSARVLSQKSNVTEGALALAVSYKSNLTDGVSAPVSLGVALSSAVAFSDEFQDPLQFLDPEREVKPLVEGTLICEPPLSLGWGSSLQCVRHPQPCA